MVNYPNGKKKAYTSNPTSAGGRGMVLEKDINVTNMFYLSIDKAVIHKKPTPVTIVKVDYPARSAAKITEAYFKLPSTTDYNGIYRGKYIDFEAKECASRTSFPLKSLHAHQVQHLQNVINHGAIAFLIVKWTLFNETYYIKAEDMIRFVKDSERHSIPNTYVTPIDYLKIIDQLYFNSGGNNDK